MLNYTLSKWMDLTILLCKESRKMKQHIDKILNIYRQLSLPLKVSVWFLFCSLLQKGLLFFTTPIFTRILSTEEYGIISIFNSWESIISIFVTLGLSYSVQNVGLVKFSDDKDNYQSAMLGLLLTCATFCFISSWLIYDYLKPIIQLEEKYIFLMLIYCIFKTIMTMWSLRKRFEYHYKEMVRVTILHAIFSTMLSMMLVFLMKDKAYAKVLGIGIITVIIGGICCLDFLRNSKKLFNKVYWKFALKYNLPMIPHFLSTMVLGQLDRIMIKNMCGSSKAGIYSVAYSSANIISILNSALHASYNPWLLQKIKSKNYTGINMVVNVILLSYMLVLWILVWFAPEILTIMAPREYYEGIYVIPPVACSMFFMLIFNIISPFEQYSLKTHFIATASTGAAVANIGLNYICIQKFGYLAAGYTTLVCYIFFAAAHYIYVKKICRNDMDGINIFESKKIGLLCILVVGIGIFSALIYPYYMIRYALFITILVIMAIKRKRLKSIIADTHFLNYTINKSSSGV